ncbi:MAG: exodeoxyribonuclease VII large subunit [Syntrophales bacterium]|nr:exodeoxyribonuclease VII large subunit [Syntrophales bacterium]
MDRVLTVSELTTNIRVLLETTFGVLWVSGEVSNLRRPGSGHIYFTLKDEQSQVRAVMFRQSASSLGFDLEEGQSLVCRGRISVYAARGDYQLLVEAAEPRGIGALQVAFEQLKRRLEAEGLFDQKNKKPLPPFPERVGVVTSPTGAVIRDILTVMKRRWPTCSVLLAPVRVQGAEAAPEICKAIDMLNNIESRNVVDVIILARGGGSMEDLQPFNDERVARAIHGSRIPVVSAVGHEIDFTISDFVADLRAPTPSAAAEIIVPDRREVSGFLSSMTAGLVSAHSSLCKDLHRRMELVSRGISNPGRKINDLIMLLDDRVASLAGGLRRGLEKRGNRVQILSRTLRNLNPSVHIREDRRRVHYLLNKAVLHTGYNRGHARGRLERARAVLDSVNPLAVLKRGYSITRRSSDGSLVRDASTLKQGNDVSVRVMSGTFHARVIDIKGEESHGGEEI